MTQAIASPHPTAAPEDGHLPASYVAGQGQCLGRDGRVHLTRDVAGQVWVGGDVVTCIEGRVTL